MPIFVCNIGWMAKYEGLAKKPDKIVNGGAFVKENEDGGETCNFVRCPDGFAYGYVETSKGGKDRKITIEHLGAKRGAPYVDHVDVVWTATDPDEGRKVIGYYRDARVYRSYQPFETFPSKQHRREELEKTHYRITALSKNAVVLRPEERHIKLGRGDGWIGHTTTWYPELSDNPEVKPFLAKVRALFRNGPGKTSSRGRSRGWGDPTDPYHKTLVEEAAIEAVENHFSDYTIESVEDQNLGWDLHALDRDGSVALQLEVKGLSGSETQVGVTPREYGALLRHKDGHMPGYRLCIVNRALSEKRRLVIFRYDTEQGRWIDERSGRLISPKFKELTAAIIALK